MIQNEIGLQKLRCAIKIIYRYSKNMLTYYLERREKTKSVD